jgi:hypothetical protein
MGMRLTRSTVILVALAVVAITEWAYIAYLRGLLNLRDVVTIVVAELIVAAILFAFSRIFGREPNPDELARKLAVEKQKLEEIDRDRKAIYDAIKEWVQPPETRRLITGQQEPLYLAERHLERAQKIDDCLSRNYPEIWADLQEFRDKYAELMALAANIPDEFKDTINGITNLDLVRLEGGKLAIRDQLLAMQRQLIRQINLEVVEKLESELKC